MTVQKFEDSEVWKKARELCKKIMELVNNSSHGKDYSIKDQILCLSGSVMDNFAEGLERDGRKEFIQFLYISKGSLGEIWSQIHRKFDAGHISDLRYEELTDDWLKLSGQLSNFITSLHRTEIQGLKKKSP